MIPAHTHLRQFHMLIAFAVVFGVKAPASTLVKSGTFGGLKVDYKVVLPNGFDSARAYPTVLALGEDLRIYGS